MKRIKLICLFVAFASFSKVSFATPGDTLIINPSTFDSSTVIHFEMGASDTVWLNVYNLAAQLIKTYYTDSVLPAGSYFLNFDGDTLPDGAYLVKLRINSTKRVEKMVKLTIHLGLNENLVNSSNKLLFPNPTSAILEIPTEGTKTIVVTDLSGKIVLNTTIQTNSISLANLENGNYIVSVFSENKELIISQQIVKASN